MTRNIGIWIDHTKAVIINLENGRTTVSQVESGERAGGSVTAHPVYSNDASSEWGSANSRLEDRRKKQLHKFYKKILHQLEFADRVFLFGPDEARLELKKEIRRSKHLFPKLIGVERAEAMTQGQMITKAKNAFFAIAKNQ